VDKIWPHIQFQPPGRKTDNLPSSIAKFKNEWSCTSISPNGFCLLQVEFIHYLHTVIRSIQS